MSVERFQYDDGIVRKFVWATTLWGLIGMLVGVILAAQLAWPALNFDIPYLSYGRLRPLHTNAVIFAFGGCALFATSYYVVQRTSRVGLFLPGLAAFTFWGWQLVILAAAIVPLVDVPVYVMTPEFGAASQLEKIDMLDFAELVAINKFDRRGAEDALRDVRK